jgi:hypothetical protein
MVGTGRFELPTCRLGGDRSIHLSYVPVPYASLPALEAFLANVFAVMQTIEVNFFDRRIGIVDG